MRKFFTIVAIVVGSVLFLLLIFAVFLEIRGIPSYDTASFTLNVDSTPARIARGQRLASLLCAECHADRSTFVFSGKKATDVPEIFGTVYTPNITRHPVKGIGAWKGAEIAYLLRTGIKRDGTFAPGMPKFPHLSDEDLFSIIAFLHSDDPRVAAADVDDQPSEYSLFMKFLTLVVMKPSAYPSAPIPAPDTTNPKAWGRYLVSSTGCFSCHSADFVTVDEEHPERSEGFLGGGNKLIDVNGAEIFTPNLTPDKETGIGRWTEAQFVRAIKQGFRPDNTVIRWPMLLWRDLTDGEARAIFAYLQSVPPIRNAPPISGYKTPPAAFSSDGARLYHTYGCIGCHGTTGVGGVYDLRFVNQRYPVDSLLVKKLKQPETFRVDSHMPRWDGVIKEEEYPALCTHVRSLARATSADMPATSR